MNFKLLLFVIAGLLFSTFYFVTDVSADESATISLDKKVYTWTDKVLITVTAPTYNLDSNSIDEIGTSNQYPIKVSTRHFDLYNYKLVETGIDTGVFVGDVILTGFTHDADGNSSTGIDSNDVVSTDPRGTGPTDGMLPSDRSDGVSVSFQFAPDKTVVGSAPIQWNEGKIKWLEMEYSATGTGVVRVIDSDMNWNPEAVDNFDVDVWSDSDAGGIDLTVTETGDATGIFEGTVFFSTTDKSSGHRLRIAGGNTVTAEYEDNTLPSPYTTADELDITATSVILEIPPLPPNKQAAMGILTYDITCKDKFVKIFRLNGFVACVDSSSVKKLLQKGWSLNSIPIDFTGQWKNKDSRTNDVVNISITYTDSIVTAHAWGSCRPDFCDWGETSGTINGNSVMFTWDVDSVTHDLMVTKIGNKLQIDRESISLDPHWIQNKQMNFIPGTITQN